MIWAIVSFWSCFCWLYRGSSSLAVKNIISLIFIDHLVMSMWRDVSCVVERECLLWPECSLGKTMVAFVLLHFVFQGQTCLLLQVSLDFLLFIPVPYDEKTFFWLLVLEGLVGLHRTVQLQLLHICGWCIDLDYCDIEWFALEMNKNHFAVLGLHPSTAFWNLLLTMRATSFLLRYSCPL